MQHPTLGPVDSYMGLLEKKEGTDCVLKIKSMTANEVDIVPNFMIIISKY